jgi:hypothetical protein
MNPSPKPSDITAQIDREVSILYSKQMYVVVGEDAVSDYPTIEGFEPQADVE